MRSVGHTSRVLAVCLCVIGIGCRPSVPFPPADPAKIGRIEAWLEARERVIERFRVRPEDYGEVIRLFEGGTVEHDRPTWVILGGMEITYADGRRGSITLFRTFKGPGAYAAGGRWYRGATDETIISTLVDCHDRSAGGTK
jgi:hypothetical protein